MFFLWQLKMFSQEIFEILFKSLTFQWTFILVFLNCRAWWNKSVRGRIQKIHKAVGGHLPACQIYRYFLFFWEFYKNNTKFQRKRGGYGPLCPPLNPSLSVSPVKFTQMIEEPYLSNFAYKLEVIFILLARVTLAQGLPSLHVIRP